MSKNDMSRRRFVGALIGGGAGLVIGRPIFNTLANAAVPKRPNFILINCDDLGYGDLGCYGSRAIKTPHLDDMAAHGVRFTDFHACDSVCTPSRAGLLTGRYPARMKLDFPLPAGNASLKNKIVERIGVIAGSLGIIDLASEEGARGINDFEITIAEALQKEGYFTAIVGKWHLGDFSRDAKYNPLNHGFASFFGVPHSNDMKPFPLYRGRDILEPSVTDIAKLTGLYTDEAIRAIDSRRGAPFFLYLAHTFPHRPLAASERFKNKSDGGIFGDAVEEIDWNFGRLMDYLRDKGLVKNTLIMFTSDNGPWYDGSPASLRGRKGQSFEGGFRVPFILRWDGTVPRGRVCPALTSNLDIFPTLISLAGAELPQDRIIDGISMKELLVNPGARRAERDIYYYHQSELEAMRTGDWKYIRTINHYVWPIPVNKKLGRLSHHTRGPLPMLFNLRDDPGEAYNLAGRFPEKVKEMASRMSSWEEAMAKNRLGMIGG